MEWTIVFYCIGVVARVVIPFLISYLETQEPFDWRYVVGQIVAAFVGVLALVLADEAGLIEMFSTVSPFMALALGYFAADVGREAQRFSGAAAIFEQ